MVAGDGHDGHAEPEDDLAEHVVQQFDGFGGRDGAVVEVAGDEHGRRPDLRHQRDELLEDGCLVGGEVDGRGRDAPDASRRCG